MSAADETREARAPGGDAVGNGAEEAPEISVVIPSWNTRELLARCLETVEEARKPATEVIVVDNGSEDGSAEMVAGRFAGVRLVRNERNEGFARACNQGMRLARGRYVLLLNTDTEVAPDALWLLWRFLEAHPGHGAAAPRLTGVDGRTQRTCQAFPNLWTALFFATPLERWFPNSPELKRYFLRSWSHEDERDVDQPPAACLLLRREVLEQVGLFDEELWLFFNDVDLSRRMAAAGWRTRYVAAATVVHHVGASTGKFGDFVSVYQRNRLTYYRKHHGRAAGWWVKACVCLAYVDYVAGIWGRRLRGLEAEPVSHITRVWLGVMRS